MNAVINRGDGPPLVKRIRRPRKKAVVISAITAALIAAGGITGGVPATQASKPVNPPLRASGGSVTQRLLAEPD